MKSHSSPAFTPNNHVNSFIIICTFRVLVNRPAGRPASQPAIQPAIQSANHPPTGSHSLSQKKKIKDLARAAADLGHVTQCRYTWLLHILGGAWGPIEANAEPTDVICQ